MIIRNWLIFGATVYVSVWSKKETWIGENVSFFFELTKAVWTQKVKSSTHRSVLTMTTKEMCAPPVTVILDTRGRSREHYCKM